MRSKFIFGMSSLFLGACSTSEKPYTHYLIDPTVVIDEALVDQGETPLPREQGTGDRTIKARWNDGKTYTEVEIPVLSSGQRIVIEHEAKPADMKKRGPEPVLPAPSVSDSSHFLMLNAYLAKGLTENTKAPEVSLSQARIKLDEAVRARNYSLALAIVEKVLNRYPSHPEFLRAKGSVLLLLGEKEKALESYETAQDIEFDPSVERKLRELDR